MTPEELDRYHYNLCPRFIGDGDECTCLVGVLKAEMAKADEFMKLCHGLRNQNTVLYAALKGAVDNYDAYWDVNESNEVDRDAASGSQWIAKARAALKMKEDPNAKK